MTFKTWNFDVGLGAALQRIEDETDLRTWHEAKAELDADPQVRTADEMARKHL